MKPCTDGERLYLLIRDRVLNANGFTGLDWPSINGFLSEVAGNRRFADYVRGAIAVHAMRRLLRFWIDEKKEMGDESQYVKKVKRIVTQEVFPGLSEDLTIRLAHAVIAAEKSSFTNISKTVHRRVVGKNGTANCYLCGRDLDEKKPEGDYNHLTLEHIWPRSMGGDSIEENLLPACRDCQEDTKDTLSWEWLNVHNLVLPTAPSENALISINGKARVAKHFEYALQIATEKKITMKQALLQIGPRKQSLNCVKTGAPITFFDLQTVEEI